MRLALKKSILGQAIALTSLYLTVAPVSAQKPCLTPPPPCLATPGANPYMPGAEGRLPPGNTDPGGTSTGAEAAPSFGDLSSGAGVGSSASLAAPGGYLDSAIPQTHFRFRYDTETGTNRFDRAEFMYGTWREGAFHPHAFVNNGNVRGIFFDPKVRGSQIISDAVSANTLTASLEVAVNQRFSGFADVPYKFVHFGQDIEDTPESAAERRQFPETDEVRNPNFNPTGFGDISAGFKYALIAEPDCRFVTFQLRAYFPTGDNDQGIGTGHYSIEPSLLIFQRLSERLVAQGEFRYWVPIGGGPAAGDVIRYGVGLGYDVIQRPCLRVTPVAELVGWTALGGTESVNRTVPAPTITVNTVNVVNVGGTFVPDDHFFKSANGDTIVNAKIGVRTYFGKGNDVYIGYGHALTGDRWYKDIISVEYRRSF